MLVFSKIFLQVGVKAKMSSGIHTSPILGKELKARPASFPATNAPDTAVRATSVALSAPSRCTRESLLRISPAFISFGNVMILLEESRKTSMAKHYIRWDSPVRYRRGMFM